MTQLIQFAVSYKERNMIIMINYTYQQNPEIRETIDFLKI